MTKKGLGCLGIAALSLAALLGFSAWVLTSNVGGVALGELKSREFERGLQGNRIDHDRVRAACEGLIHSAGMQGVTVLKDHETPMDPLVPAVVRELEPDRIVASTNQVALAWNTQLGVCGLVYYSAGTDLGREMAIFEQGFSDARRTKQTVTQVADQVLFYSYRLDILGF